VSEQQASSIVEGFAPFRGHRTWYRVTGDLKAARTPAVIVHGGPGCTHDYVDSFKLLAQDGRAVIHYDQIGNGRSTHLRDKGADFWTVDFFRSELNNLIDHLGIRGAHHVVGQSWGGMLAAEYGVTRPDGLVSLTLADSPASLDTWVKEANRLRAELPPEVNATLLKHETDGTTDHPDYTKAMMVFYDRHVCRVVPNPPEVARTFAAIGDDPTVYHTMNGPSEFHVIGSLKGWTIEDRLHHITVPTLLITGKYDEATELTQLPFRERIPNVAWRVFEHSSHMPHVEETALCMQVVGDFLRGHDRAG
jgi:L-proline amide hydrolase